MQRSDNILKIIRESKKPKSAVRGDILPRLVNECADITAIPAFRIINFSLQLKQWPAAWRLETQTAIPKKESTTSFDQLRNISCTNGLSKVMEAIFLEKLLEEISLKSNQYGGI